MCTLYILHTFFAALVAILNILFPVSIQLYVHLCMSDWNLLFCRCRQMKDQSKKVANLKHKEQVEKSKNAQLMEEARKREDNINESSQQVKVKYTFCTCTIMLFDWLSDVPRVLIFNPTALGCFSVCVAALVWCCLIEMQDESLFPVMDFRRRFYTHNHWNLMRAVAVIVLTLKLNP